MEMLKTHLLFRRGGRTAVAGGGGGALVKTGVGDPSHLTSKESEWKFPSTM